MASPDFLHNHRDFPDLLRIVGERMGIAPVLVEKDYWIMHCLYGLQQLGLQFELKGGTSLSKGFGIIGRFSEDIDIRIEPPVELAVRTGRQHDKPAHVDSRARFYDWLATTIRIDGVAKVERDTAFDDVKMRSAGIRLLYPEATGGDSDLKQGVLLEAGFDDVTPNTSCDISSWAYDFAAETVTILDNRAFAVLCYDPGYTLVEKLQTISTKYRKQQDTGSFPANFLRHYYDVYCLLGIESVKSFIGTEAYRAHKQKRFRSEEKDITKNPAFSLKNEDTFVEYARAYERTKSLYYKERPSLRSILERIAEHASTL